jgi:transposase
MFYLGIDLHARQITVNLRNDLGDVLLRRQVSTEPEKVTQFFQDLTARCLEAGCGFWAMVEVCGFQEWLLEMLKNFRCERIVLVHPEDRGRRKTDRRDAAKLSELLWLFRDRIASGKPIDKLRIIVPPTSVQLQQRRLTTLRKDARARQTRATNRLKHVLRRHNLQHQMPSKTFPTVKALAWLKTLKLAPTDRLELDHALEDYDRLLKRVAELDAAIAEISVDDLDAQLLLKTPGLAQFSSVALSSRICGIERFKRPRALANYFGLTPGCRNSGENNDRLGRITKAGSSMARWVLGQASKHVLRVDPAMRAWFKRLKRKKGPKIARVAVMRRMATIIWHMLTKRKTYAEIRMMGIGLEG